MRVVRLLTTVHGKRTIPSMIRAAETRTRELYSAIGRRIRELREKKGLSLQEVAERSGFAKSYLSQIENLKREPSLSALSQVAYVLGVDVLYLLTGELQNPLPESLTIVRREKRKRIDRAPGSPSYLYESITYNRPGRLMEGFIVTLGSQFPPEPFVHEGEELAYVLEGKHEFVYDGRSYILEEGDCYYFDSKKPHFGRALGKKQAKILVVFTAKKD